jgi:hypothetical protein
MYLYDGIKGRFIRVLLFTLSFWLMECTPPPFEFALSNTYRREYFSGRDVGNKVIGVYLLLQAAGGSAKKELPSSLILRAVHKARPDLLFAEPDSVSGRLQKELSPGSVERFQTLLFNGEVVALQESDTAWRTIGYDYLLAVRLRHGMDIRTFNQMLRKRVVLEAELWDCSQGEAAWRVIVNGQCSRKGYTDRQFLLEALSSIAAALPSAFPAYDSKSW